MKKIIILILLIKVTEFCFSQHLILDIHSICDKLSMQSTEGVNAKLHYTNEKLNEINTNKEYLPSISFSLNPISLNRSIRVLQNPTDGNYSYITDYSNSSSAGLTLNQKVPFTNGIFSVSSNINMLTELNRNKHSFSSIPYSFGYQQRIIGEYKLYKYKRTLETFKNKKTEKDYIYKIAEIQQKSVVLFLECCIKKISTHYLYEQSRMSDSLLSISRIRYKHGLLLEKDLLLLELQNANEHWALEEEKLKLRNALSDLFEYLNLERNDANDVELVYPQAILPLTIDKEIALIYMRIYNPYKEDILIRKTEADQNVYSARIQQWINARISLNYGTNHFGNTFQEAYINPSSQQAVMLSIQIPIFDWGIGKNKVRIAKNIHTQNINSLSKEESEIETKLRKEVDIYNSLMQSHYIAKRSYELAKKNVEISLIQLNKKALSIDKLIENQNNMKSSYIRYIKILNDIWKQLFKIRSMCLYDFITDKPLT